MKIEYAEPVFLPDEILNAPKRQRELLALEWWRTHDAELWVEGELVGFDATRWTAVIFNRYGQLIAIHGSKVRKVRDAATA